MPINTRSNTITDNSISKITNVLLEKRRNKNEVLENSSINMIFLLRLPVQNYLERSVTEICRNKVKKHDQKVLKM